MFLTYRKLASYLLAITMLAGFSGCDLGTADGMGTLSVLMTDAPFPADLALEANVTVTKLEARSAGGNESSPYITLSEGERTFNLLDLRNGVIASLASIEVPSGSYDLLRIYISAGSVVLKDSTTFNLTVPSGAQTGLKLFISPAIDVTDGTISNLILDFDVEKSFVVQGSGNAINGFLFKPVIRVANVSTVGSLAGSATNSAAAAIEGAHIWVAQDTVVSNTYSNADGNFAILGLPAGSYTASASATGYDTVSASIDISAGSQTTVSFELTQQ